VEIGRIKCEKGKKQDHQQQAPQGEFGQITYYKHNSKHQLNNNQGNGNNQREGNQKFQVEHLCTKIFLKFKGKTDRVVQFYKSGDNK